MRSTLSTLYCKSARIYLREWSISHDVKKVYHGEPINKDVTRQGICSMDGFPDVEMFLVLEKASSH